MLLILLLILRWFRSQGTTERNLTLFFAATLLVISAIWGLQPGLKLYPVLVNAGLLITFGITLYFPPTMIERFARIHEPNLSASGVTYTRHVTLAWCVFFAVNGLIALATVLWASDEIWLLYNGMISYCLIAALVAGEWLIRRRVKRRYDD